MKQFIFVLAAATLPVVAAPRTQIFTDSCDGVWAAVKRATAPPHYNFAMLDDAQKKGIVSTGSTLTGKRNLDITLSGSGDSCTVAIGGAFSGLTHDDKGALFKRIGEELSALPSASAPAKPDTAATMAPKTGEKNAMTNADVLYLKSGGLSDDTIIDTIKASPASFSLEAKDLVELKKAGLTDPVIRAMIQASQR
jgi:hypothetical protein